MEIELLEEKQTDKIKSSTSRKLLKIKNQGYCYKL